jgi:arylsulfatase A-like enzyme
MLHGALVGLIYGLLEYALVVAAPMVRWRPCALVPGHWLWTALFISIYIVLGAAIASIAALSQKVNGPQAAGRATVAVALLALVAGRIMARGAAGPHLVLDIFLIVLAGLNAASMFTRRETTWVSWMLSPWVSIGLMLGAVKLEESFNSAAKFGGAVLGLGAIAAIFVYAASRSRILSRTIDNRFLPLTAAACGLMATALVAVSLFLNAPARLPAGPATIVARNNRPNVLLIVLDTVRADHTSVYGYSRRTTPNLEAFAQEGVLFRNAISASDITLSSHASIYTGLYPSWHRAYLVPVGDPPPLDSSFRTMAETLSDSGYSTMAILANCAYLRPIFHLNQGFQLYDVRTVVNGSTAGGGFYLRDLLRRGLDRFMLTAELDREYRRADDITDDGLRVFGAMQSRAAPFFLNLNYMDAHDPYIPPAPYRDLFPGRNPSFRASRVHQLHRELALLQRPASLAGDLTHIESQYDGAITYVDSQVKRLLEGLKTAGLYDNTLVIVTSDHGEALGERSALGHPVSVHQELVHVPLLIKYPKSTAAVSGQQVDAYASGVDLLPTVLDVAGIPIPANLQGVSLRTLDPHADRMVWTASFPDNLSRLRRRTDLAQHAVYQKNWKLIGSTTGQRELYDVGNDPKELQNLYGDNTSPAQSLNAALNDWMSHVPRMKVLARKIDPQTRERLRSLGYVQ